MINICEIRVRYKETDAMGVSYYGNYFTWFEVGRNSIFRELGIPYRIMEDKGIFAPVLEAYSKYHSSTHYDDLLLVHTRITQLTGIKVKFQYEIFRDFKLTTTGWTLHCFVNKEGKPINIKKTHKEIWEKLANIVQGGK